jgi:replicative DNA helicase
MKITNKKECNRSINVDASPPTAIDAEKSVLCACLIEIGAIDRVISIIKPESFYLPIHAVIFRKILDLYNASSPIDLLTVYEGLKTNEIFEKGGGISYLSSLSSYVASTIYVEKHAMIVKEKEIRRNIIRDCFELIRESYDESCDIEDLLRDFNVKSDEACGDINTSSDIVTIEEATKNALLRFQVNQDTIRQGGLTGITTGSFVIDKKIGRLQPGNLVIIAARPSMGKTAFALNLIVSAAIEGDPGCVVSLEMMPEELVNRMLIRESDKFRSDILKNTEAYDNEIVELNKVAGTIEKLPITFIKNRSVTVSSLKSKCRKLRKKNKLNILIVDYLQLMGSDKGNNREQEIAYISRELKKLAEELKIPIIALSQLNRGVEARADKKPMLSDLRESGSIEQDADIVFLLNRPAKYDIKEIEDDNGRLISTDRILVCDIAKQRNGEIGDVLLNHNNTVTKIWDYSDVF